MNVTTVFATPAGPAESAVRRWTLTHRVGAAPSFSFRRELQLRLPVPAGVEQLMLDGAATQLSLRFGSLEYDALDAANPFGTAALVWGDGGKLARVMLDGPREFSAADFRGGNLQGKRLELYRVDGEAISEKPTLSHTLGQHTVARERSELALSKLGDAAGAASGAQVLAAPASPPSPSGKSTAEPFVAQEFALRLRNAVGAAESLSALLAGVRMRGHPIGARVGVLTPPPPNTAATIGYIARPKAGEVVALGALFAQEVNRLLERAGAPSSPLTLVLVLEADAPCTVDVIAFQVAFRFVQRAFAASQPQQRTLRFDGSRSQSRELELQLPAQASIVSAALEVEESFGATRALGASDASAVQRGVEVAPERWVAQSVTPAAAVSVTGVALALSAREAGTQLLLRLREEWQSGPLGATLAEAQLELEPGRREWLVARFPRPLPLDARPYWLLLRAARGRATWLAAPGAVGPHLLLEQGARFEPISHIDGLEALSHFLSAQQNLSSVAPVRVSVGTHPVTGTSAGTRRSFDLRGALMAELSRADGANPRTLPLVFTSALPGLLTVYAPHIEYEL